VPYLPDPVVFRTELATGPTERKFNNIKIWSRRGHVITRYWETGGVHDVPLGQAVPTHVSNSHVHQIIVRGVLSLRLEDGEFHDHPAGTIVGVPFNKKMVIQNNGDETLEFFVVKAPNPRDMPKTKEI